MRKKSEAANKEGQYQTASPCARRHDDRGSGFGFSLHDCENRISRIGMPEKQFPTEVGYCIAAGDPVA